MKHGVTTPTISVTLLYLDRSARSFFKVSPEATFPRNRSTSESFVRSAAGTLETLETSYCDNIATFPELPPSLRYLRSAGTRLEDLPTLPAGLQFLLVPTNNLTQLPPLPDGLIQLDLSDNELTDLPATLPPNLTLLNINNNYGISNLPALPDTLSSLYIRGTDIRTLPPNSVVFLAANEALQMKHARRRRR